jgi:predicted enzyme involved in methoxymalonyl-ACP biosynthesis
VLLAKTESDALVIDTWLMSCRVLKRGVERVLLNSIVEQAKERGLKRIVGEYIPTPKNGLVRDHYPSLGFTQIENGSGETTRWQLLVDGWEPQPHFIRGS